MQIGNKIRRMSINAGMTQEQLANKLGVSGQSVSKWERGVSVPEISNLKKISHILGVSVDYLIDNE